MTSFGEFAAVDNGTSEIRRVRRAVIVWGTVYIWGHDGQQDRVWRWRAMRGPVRLWWPRGFWRSRWRPHPGWQHCGRVHRAWAWVVWWLASALTSLTCRSVVQWDKPRGGKDLRGTSGSAS